MDTAPLHPPGSGHTPLLQGIDGGLAALVVVFVHHRWVQNMEEPQSADGIGSGVPHRRFPFGVQCREVQEPLAALFNREKLLQLDHLHAEFVFGEGLQPFVPLSGVPKVSEDERVLPLLRVVPFPDRSVVIVLKELLVKLAVVEDRYRI